MYAFRFQIARVRNMWNEFLRLNSVMFTKSERRMDDRTGLQARWEMASITGPSGMPYRYMTVETEIKDPSWAADYRYITREDVKIPRDFLDQVITFTRDVIGTYVGNVFGEQTCTHPHDKVWREWDGEDEYGYTLQHRCNRCLGYINPEDIDRYLPEAERHPELIKGNPVHPFDRPGHKYNRAIDDTISNICSEDDTADYSRASMIADHSPKAQPWPPEAGDAYWTMDDWNQGLSEYLADQPCPLESDTQRYAGWKEGEKLYKATIS